MQLLVVGQPFRFGVVQSELVIDGYQLYAVEKWVVDRSRHIATLVVYTGDPTHKITVSAVTLSASLSPQEAAAEWDRALEMLRKDGARPRDTPHGVLMTTSLANFRSDYTIVHIPTGNFRDVQHQLYANINLLRMGSSGRTALGLDEPSETTKDRFLSVYHIPYPTSISVTPMSTPFKHKKSKSLDPSKFRQHTIDTHRHLPEHPLVSPPPAVVPDSRRTATNTLFCTTVIELVRIIQASLTIFGLFPPGAAPHTKSNIDGLLCDNTVDGIQRWIDEIGRPYLGIEPTERVLDPTVVSALLSLVLSTRNKLSAIGYAHVVPKDPFLHPNAMTAALATYSHTSPHAVASVRHQSTARGPLPLSPTSSSSSSSAPTGHTILTHAYIQAINWAYDRIRHTDPRRVHRARAGKADDRRGDGDVGDLDFALGGAGSGADGTTQILSGIGSLASGFTFGLSGGGTGGAGAVFDVVLDLKVFARLVTDHGPRDKKARGKGKEGEMEWEERKKDSGGRDKDRDSSAIGASLRALWSGKIETLVRIREREKEKAAKTSPGNPKDRREGGREQSAFSDGDGEADFKVVEDEGEFTPNSRPWSGKMQRRIEALAGRSRKKQSADLNTLSPSKGNILSEPSISPTLRAAIPKHKDREAGEDEELLSSGQVSPILDLKAHPFNVLPEGSMAAGLAASLGNSAFNLAAASDYERRLSAFNQKRPWSNRVYQSRVSSWADPLSAQEIVEEEDDMDLLEPGLTTNFRRRATPSFLDIPEEISEIEPEKVTKALLAKGLLAHGLKRRHSFHDLESLQHMRVSRLDHLRIDVGLCGQILIMSRRAPHLRNVIACLQLFTSALSETTASLHEEYQSHTAALSDVESRTKVFAEVNAQRLHADGIGQETNTLLYETSQFDVRALWHTASPPRRHVFALREKVFGTGGRRLPRGSHGAHGRYNRQQWALDERERLVDWMGRTESEEEEENAVDAARMEAPPGEDDEEDVVEHPAMKPMWLLKFFETWGGRWGLAKQQEDEKGRNGMSTALTVPSRDSGPRSRSLWSQRSASPSSGSDRDMHTAPQ